MTDLEKQAIIAKGYELVPHQELTEPNEADLTPAQKRYHQWLKVSRGKEPTTLVYTKFLRNSEGEVLSEVKEYQPTFSTLKVLEYIMEPDIAPKDYVNDQGLTYHPDTKDLTDFVSSNLGGLHFNTPEELEDYFTDLVRPYLNKLAELKASDAPGYEYHNVETAFQCLNPFKNIKLTEFEYISTGLMYGHKWAMMMTMAYQQILA